eukprot:TRINITY_DN1559_c0_g1_i1.p1 TRINITY_DN1559_c0_g1~~TRINITY_DN1559_c0_g1_i1.p1  ORF type:complete len:375 (-),score=146.35 TRINITY_DN1559_c0_g1_i1:793-1917(-)
MKQILSFLLLLCFLQLSLSVTIDRKNPLQDLKNTNCDTRSFSACAVRNVQLLVTQVIQDLNETRFDGDRFQRVFMDLNAGGPEYRLGTGFTVAVYNENVTKIADSADNSTNGFDLDTVNDKRGILTSATIRQQYQGAGLAGGSWVDDVYYMYNDAKAVPTLRKTWVDGIVINKTRYIIASSFDNTDPQLIGRACDATKFADCALDLALNLVGLVSKELTYVLPSQLPSYWTNIATANKYKANVGFAVTVASAADGSILAHSGKGQVVGKKLNDISAGSLAAFNDAATAGGLWVVHSWSEGGATYSRQSYVVPVKPTDGNTYLVFSGYGTTSESKCPACVCPTCPAVKECPLCPEITPCDGTEVTKLQLDFKNMI